MTQLADEFRQDFCNVVLGLYVFTGEDTNAAFKGKLNPLNKLQTHQSYQACFRSLGESYEIIEAFVCAMYGYPRIKSVDAVRLLKLEEVVKRKSKTMLKSAKVYHAVAAWSPTSNE